MSRKNRRIRDRLELDTERSLPTTVCRSGKRAYRSWATAARNLSRVRASADPNSTGPVPVRYYECNLCRFWHLTSKEQR